MEDTGDFHVRRLEESPIYFKEKKGLIIVVSADVTPDVSTDLSEKVRPQNHSHRYSTFTVTIMTSFETYVHPNHLQCI